MAASGGMAAALGGHAPSRRGGDEMDVVVHQAVAEQLQPEALRLRRQQFEVHPPIVVHEEHVLPVIAALGDMVRNAGDNDAGNSWHRPILPRGRKPLKEPAGCSSSRQPSARRPEMTSGVARS